MSNSYVCFPFSVDVQPTVDLQAVSGGQEESGGVEEGMVGEGKEEGVVGEGKEDDSVGNLPSESRQLTVACHMGCYCCLLFFVAPSCGESEGVKLGEGESVTAQDEPIIQASHRLPCEVGHKEDSQEAQLINLQTHSLISFGGNSSPKRL